MLAEFINTLTPAQREQLAALLPAVKESPPVLTVEEPAKQPGQIYDLSGATEYTFKAALGARAGQRDTSYLTYDHVWCKGNVHAIGPKGGDHFVGRLVLGVKKGQQVKGILRVSSAKFLAFQRGEAPLDAWVRIDGQKDAILIGALSQFRAA